MNTITFMPMPIPHCGGGGDDIAGFLAMILTFFIVGIILYLVGIFANILKIKFSNGFAYTPICWHDVKPGEIDNSILGWLGGVFGFAFVGASLLIGLVGGIYYLIITL